MNKDDKRIEDLISKLMSADRLEQAPHNFTENVMSKIEALPNSKTFIYKPLIPKYVLWFITVSFIGFVGYVVFQSSENSISLSEKYNLPDVSLNLLEGLSVDFSTTFMYAIVLFVIMLSIQIPLLKQYLNNRLTY
jgi:hypothetical protein